jgi:hypothetical protein
VPEAWQATGYHFRFGDRRGSAGVPSPDDVSNTESSLQLFPQTSERVRVCRARETRAWRDSRWRDSAHYALEPIAIVRTRGSVAVVKHLALFSCGRLPEQTLLDSGSSGYRARRAHDIVGLNMIGSRYFWHAGAASGRVMKRLQSGLRLASRQSGCLTLLTAADKTSVTASARELATAQS